MKNKLRKAWGGGTAQPFPNREQFALCFIRCLYARSPAVVVFCRACEIQLHRLSETERSLGTSGRPEGARREHGHPNSIYSAADRSAEPRRRSQYVLLLRPLLSFFCQNTIKQKSKIKQLNMYKNQINKSRGRL